MIIFFRKLNDSFLGKLFMAFVGLGMVLTFGVAGVFASLGTKTTALSVGGRRVSIQELDRELNSEIRRMASQSYVSPKEAIQMGLLSKIVTKKKNDLLKDVMLDDIGTVASDASVRNYLLNNPLFQTITGQFDRQLFSLYLSRLQMSEAQFAMALQTELSEKHISDAVLSVIKVPQLALDKVYAYENEKRDFDVLLITPDKVKVSGQPTDEEINDYYEAMQDELYTPEYRQISVLTLSGETLGKNIAVSEEEVKNLYDSNKDQYVVPEKRHLRQILVSEEKLPDFEGKVTVENFDEMAKQNGQTAEDTDLGWVEKNSVNEAVGEASFDIKKGEITGPVKSEWGYHFVKVEDVESAKETPFADVKEDLKKRLVSEKVYEILYDKSRELNDALGAGESLKDISKKMNIPLVVVDFIDVEGSYKNKDGKAEILPELLRQAFMIEEGETTAAIEDKDAFVVAEVDHIEASVLPPVEKVKEKLVAEWTKDKQKAEISSFADKVYNAIQMGSNFKTVATSYGLDERELPDVKRSELREFPADVSKKLFSLKQGKIELLPAGESFVVVKTLKITEADKDDKIEMINVGNSLKQLVVEGLKEEILDFYGKEVGVEIDQELIDKTFAVYLNSEN